MNVSEKRFFVKIVAGEAPGGNPCIYFNKDLRFETFMKWKWYFDYRAAFYKITYPKHKVDLLTGSYDYIAPRELQIKALRDSIAGKKRVITMYKNKIQMAKSEWNELFPIEDEPMYQKAISKVEKSQTELDNLQISLIIKLNSDAQN